MGVFLDVINLLEFDVDILILLTGVFSAIIFFGFIGFNFELYRFAKMNGNYQNNKEKRKLFSKNRKRREKELKIIFLECIKYASFGLGFIVITYFFKFNVEFYFILVFGIVIFSLWNLLYVRKILIELNDYLLGDCSRLNKIFGISNLNDFDEFSNILIHK